MSDRFYSIKRLSQLHRNMQEQNQAVSDRFYSIKCAKGLHLSQLHRHVKLGGMASRAHVLSSAPHAPSKSHHL